VSGPTGEPGLLFCVGDQVTGHTGTVPGCGDDEEKRSWASDRHCDRVALWCSYAPTFTQEKSPVHVVGEAIDGPTPVPPFNLASE